MIYQTAPASRAFCLRKKYYIEDRTCTQKVESLPLRHSGGISAEYAFTSLPQYDIYLQKNY